MNRQHPFLENSAIIIKERLWAQQPVFLKKSYFLWLNGLYYTLVFDVGFYDSFVSMMIVKQLKLWHLLLSFQIFIFSKAFYVL